MPPLPKPPGQRVRRNKDQSEWKQLPAGGSGLKAPALPTKKPAWLKSTKTKWERLWASPMATTFTDADGIALERMALLWDEIARGDTSAGKLGAVQQLVAAGQQWQVRHRREPAFGKIREGGDIEPA